MGLLHSGDVSDAGFWVVVEHFCPTLELVNVLEKVQR